MKYGLTRKLDVYCYETQVGETLTATTGDYLRATMWSEQSLGDVKAVSEGAADLYATFAWAWCVLKRLGKLEEYGIATELDMESLEDMTDRVSVYFHTLKADELPLATAQDK